VADDVLAVDELEQGARGEGAARIEVAGGVGAGLVTFRRRDA